MGRQIGYTIYNYEWHIDIDLFQQFDVCSVFRPIIDYDPEISLKRQAEQYISHHLAIPVDKLKSQIVHYEDMLLDEVIYMIRTFQFGGYSSEDFEKHTKGFIDQYLKTFMDELYHTGLALGKELDEKRFQERRTVIQQNHAD